MKSRSVGCWREVRQTLPLARESLEKHGSCLPVGPQDQEYARIESQRRRIEMSLRMTRRQATRHAVKSIAQGPGRLVRNMRRRATRLLQRHTFLTQLAASDVVVVTYPKSGTTWLAFLLANLRKTDADDEPTLHNVVQFIPHLAERPATTPLLSAAASLPAPRFFTAHSPYERAFPNVVYVLRDPRAVMISYWHYKRFLDATFRPSIREFVQRNDHRPCRWDEHVAGWLLEHRHPHLLVVRYEDLCRDTVRVLRRILAFAGVSYSPAAITAAVEASRFDRMQALEHQYGPVPRGMSHERFIRRGEVDSWRDELDAASVRIIEQKYGRVMQIVGYA